MGAGAGSFLRSHARPAALIAPLVLILGQALALPSPAPARKRVIARAEPQSLPSEVAAVEPGSSPPPAPSTSAPAGAGEEGSPKGDCTLALEAGADVVSADEPLTLTGSLACAGDASAGEGQTVAIYRHSAGTPGFQLAGEALGEAGGSFHISTEALDADSVFYATAGGLRSARVRVTVLPLVTISGPPSGSQLLIARHRLAASAGPTSTVTLTGTVMPAQAGTRVLLQRAFGEEDWVTVARGVTGADGEYALTHTFGLPGQARVRVLARAHGHLGLSETLTFEIVRAQNRRLTLQASTPSLAYGQAVTLSGVLSGGARTELTLLAGTGTGEFTPVASTLSEEDGSYSFPAQTPLQDTSYRVSDGRTQSTVLLEGVKPLLSVQASQSTAASGQPVTFSGSVTPATPGQRVTLECQNEDGSGFHAVAQGSVGADGSFSIRYVLSGEGTQQFRVLVPADTAMQAVASAPIALQAPLALAAPLAPQAIGAGS